MTRKLWWGALCGALVLLLTGCWSPPSDEPGWASQYSLPRYFKDRQAQALALAAEQNRVEDVRRLMKDEGVNPDLYFTDDGMPLLAWPILTDSPQGLQAMLENGADPNARKLHPAQHDERFKGRYFGNAMVWAARHEDPIYLKLLLDHGGDPNTRNSDDENLLFQAFIHQDQWQNIQLLVERGADINAMSQGTTLLFDYAGRGGFQRAYWLLEHGADPKVHSRMHITFPPPPAEPIYATIEAIFWHPGNPKNPVWQRKCQQWLLAHGYKRPPIPDDLRRMRKDLGMPYEEKDIPLPYPLPNN